MKSIDAAIGNADRADQVVNIAEGGLQEVSGLLTELQGLVTATANKAGLGESEKAANQLQVDSILQTIDRIASATSFQGTKLLNGNFDYKVSSVASGISDYQVRGAKFAGNNLNVNVLVTQSAQQAALYLSLGGTALDLAAANSSFTIEVGGALGSRQLTFASGTSMSDIQAAIHSFKDVTGIDAAVVASGTSNGIKIFSTDFGSSKFSSVKVINDGGLSTTNLGLYDFNTNDFNALNTTRVSDFATGPAINGYTDNGVNMGCTINGIVATTNGKTARINTDSLDVQLTLDDSTSQTLGQVGSGSAFKITGGGADFQLAGKVDIAGKVSLGIGDVAVRKLGDSNVGYLSTLSSGNANDLVNGDATAAQKVVSSAIDQVSQLRGRLGAFQKNTIGATIRSLGIAQENTAAAQSTIADANFASETANLTRNQILVSASTQVLQLANSTPQSVLQLLG
jgi:flagellin